MIDLMKFCEKDNPFRDYLCQPWSVGEYTYAANGHIGVRVPRRNDVPENPAAPDFEGRILANAPPTKDLKPIPSFVMPDLKKPCSDCNGFGFTEKCTDCDGEGTFECIACGHDASCKTCDETGEVKIKSAEQADKIRGSKKAIECVICDGERIVENQNIWARVADDLWFDPRYLALIAELPNSLLDLGAEDGGRPVRFVFDGGEGVLMPMRAPITEVEQREDAIVLDLRPGSQTSFVGEAAE